MAAGDLQELLSSFVADIKNYAGGDPLRPWIHGIRRMRQSMPPQILKQKLPRFLQKCAETFESDGRYHNDSRYLRVWIELMDYVDDAKVVLRRMEKKKIGSKRAVFYLAYAMYYEKQKKFQEAEKMYHAGMQNLAEPVEELQKSYEKFLHRMELYKKKKAKLQEVISVTGKATSKLIESNQNNTTEKEGKKQDQELVLRRNVQRVEAGSSCQNTLSSSALSFPNQKMDDTKPTENLSKPFPDNCTHLNNSNKLGATFFKRASNHKGHSDMNLDEPAPSFNEDTVVVKFVGSAIVGKSEAEDACHHGLVDPTINMKEAMSAISSMFREPLELEPITKRRSDRSKPNKNQQSSGFQVYIDEGCCDGPNCSQDPENGNGGSKKSLKLSMHSKKEIKEPDFNEFKILADDPNENEGEDDEAINTSFPVLGEPTDSLYSSISSKSRNSKYDNGPSSKMLSSVLSDETIFHRFVGSTIFSEQKLENACHHGLIEPTLTLKEAMDDINNMFGEPLDFKGVKQKKKQHRAFEDQGATSEVFSILADENLEEPKVEATSTDGDLFEPTLFTQEAMANINELFGKPLDF